jgi:hypothetical protein
MFRERMAVSSQEIRKKGKNRKGIQRRKRKETALENSRDLKKKPGCGNSRLF